jgi:hypothetical protein
MKKKNFEYRHLGILFREMKIENQVNENFDKKFLMEKIKNSINLRNAKIAN